MGWARWAVIFFHDNGRPAKTLAEIISYNEAYNNGTAWADSQYWG